MKLLGLIVLTACGAPHDFTTGDASVDVATFGDVQLPDSGATCGQYVFETYDPGPDGLLGTSDDVVRPGREVQTVTPYAQISVVTRDTTYGANDAIVRDVRIVATSTTTYDQLTFDGPGADGTWGTADDHVAGRSSGIGPMITPSAVYEYLSPGPDNVWATSDDVVSRWSSYVYGDGTSTPFLQEWQYTSPGTANLGVVTSRFTGWGMFSTAAGPDGTWGTKDDVIYGRYTDERNTNGRFQFLTAYDPHDAVTSIATITCDAGVYDARIVNGPGPDAQWGTSDDVVQTRIRTTACGSCDDLPKSPVAPN